MSREFTLANHVQELLDERAYWLAAPSLVGRRRQAENIDGEIAEAVELLRSGRRDPIADSGFECHGYMPCKRSRYLGDHSGSCFARWRLAGLHSHAAIGHPVSGPAVMALKSYGSGLK